MRPYYLLVAAAIANLLSHSAPAQTTKQHAFLWDRANGMRDLGTLGGDVSWALAINDAGTVVGFSYLADNVTQHAFVWNPGTGMIDLGAPPGFAQSAAHGINMNGDIVGVGYIGYDGGDAKAFFWSASTGFVLIFAPESGTMSGAYGINGHQEVAGLVYITATSAERAFLWSPALGEPRLLGAPWDARALAISNRGHITGDVKEHAFVWAKSGFEDLGKVRDGEVASAVAINDKDEVTGYGSILIDFSVYQTGFYWNPSLSEVAHLRPIGGPSCVGNAINEYGVIAGWSNNSPAGGGSAALWRDYKSAPEDLGTLPGGAGANASGINNYNQVVGSASVP